MISARERSRTIEDLRERIGRVPRVSLGDFPTPLTECPRLAELLGGPRLYVKREDLSGLALGGNKTRLLEFRLAEAVALGCDVVIAGLELQSNSARQLTAAANRLGLRTVLLLQADEEPEWQGNLLLDRILGAEIRFVPARGTDIDRAMEEAVAEERRRGHAPYVMNHARMFGPGAALAGLEWTLETLAQLDGRGARPSHFYVSSGGKCQAGMVLAQLALGRPFRVVGIDARPEPRGATETTHIANATAELLGLDVRVDPSDVESRNDFAGPGFGVPTPDGIEAIELVARQEGIFLDPVFTGKAMAGLLADIRQGALGRDDTVVFVHTGGIPALFAYAGAFLDGSAG